MTSRRSLVLTAGLVAGATGLPAQSTTPADLPAKIDLVFARFARPESPGCAVGVAKDGKTLYTHGYGSANLEYRVPLTDSTVLESGSVAKQFTSSAIVLLAHEGKLSLDDDIRKYLPEVPPFGGAKITIRHLMTHTSGLRDQWGLLGIEGRGPGTQVHSPATTLDLVAHQKILNFPPGARYLYSNTGYALLGVIVQRVSGKTLDAFTQERFFKPLGMTHTQWRDDFTEVVPNRATAYSGSDAAGYHTDMPFTNMIGNGGLLSTVHDLLKWNENLDNPAVGGKGYVDAMQTRMTLTNGRTITYALGLEVADYDGVREIAHGGSTAGYRTHLARYPDQRVSIAVWCNSANANPAGLLHQVADLVLTKPQRAAVQAGAPVVKLSREQLARWAGTYRDAFTDQAVTLVVADSGLASAAGGRGGGRGGAAAPYLPTDPSRFHSGQTDVVFSGTAGRRTLAMIRGDDTARYEEARPAAAIATSDYIGTYASDELDVRLEVVARDGKLMIRRRPDDVLELRPAYADDFQAQGLGTIRFARDGSNKVAGFAIFAGRVVDVRFRKVPSSIRVSERNH
jgi:CubicO group peptidase (beta-lactamase class C family)